jgi:FtsH-binding integral membrane protein
MTPALTIRFAMLLGVLLFGAVVYVTRLSPDAPTLTPEKLRSLRLIGQVLWVVAVGGGVFALQQFQRAESRGQRQTFAIIGWALGEMVALYGAVVWFLGGSPGWYIPGLVFFLITFLVFPTRRD